MIRKILGLSICGLVLIGLSAPSFAQVIAQFPEPHAAKCSDFHHKRSTDTWIPKGIMQVTTGQGTASIGPSDSFTAGKLVEGLDMAKWLDSGCGK